MTDLTAPVSAPIPADNTPHYKSLYPNARVLVMITLLSALAYYIGLHAFEVSAPRILPFPPGGLHTITSCGLALAAIIALFYFSTPNHSGKITPRLFLIGIGILVILTILLAIYFDRTLSRLVYSNDPNQEKTVIYTLMLVSYAWIALFSSVFLNALRLPTSRAYSAALFIAPFLSVMICLLLNAATMLSFDLLSVRIYGSWPLWVKCLYLGLSFFLSAHIIYFIFLKFPGKGVFILVSIISLIGALILFEHLYDKKVVMRYLLGLYYNYPAIIK